MLSTIADAGTLAAAHARSRAVAGAWLHGEAHSQANAAFDGTVASAEAAADRAAALIGDDGWIAGLLDPLVAALQEDIWFQPPFRVSRDGLRLGAILFDHPAVSISAAVLSADRLATLPPPRTVVVPGRLSVVRFWRAGGATLNLWRTNVATTDFREADAPPCRRADPAPLHDGQLLRIDGRTHAQLITGATSDVVTITATIRLDSAPFMREYAIDSGALVRLAALDDRSSRTEMLLALLRHAGRHDAGAVFEAATHDPAFFVRWAAIREWLACDAAAALPRLRAMTMDANADVAAAAAQTLHTVEGAIAKRAALCPA